MVSVTSLAGALALVDHWHPNRFAYSGIVALVGAAAALLINAMVLFETFRGDSIGYRVLWGLLTAGSLWAVIAVWRTSVVIPAPKQVAAVGLVSLVLAFANFGYQNLYQPYQRGAKPVIKMTVGKPLLRQDRKAFSVPVDIRFVNDSDVGFYVLGAEFHAMGERVEVSARGRLRAQWRADAEQWSKAQFQETHPLARWEVHHPGELVAAHPWTFAGNWIEPGDELYSRTVVQLPINTPYDQLAFYATASLARKDRLGLEQVPLKGYSWDRGRVPQWIQKDTDSVIYRGRVHENNAIDAHTMDPRYVTVYWMFGPHGAAVLSPITRKGEEDRIPSGAERRELAIRYGLVHATSGPFERTLWDIKRQ